MGREVVSDGPGRVGSLPDDTGCSGASAGSWRTSRRECSNTGALVSLCQALARYASFIIQHLSPKVVFFFQSLLGESLNHMYNLQKSALINLRRLYCVEPTYRCRETGAPSAETQHPHCSGDEFQGGNL